MQFIHLRLYTDYSLGLGVIKIKDLVKFCASSQIPAVAVSDKNNLCASLEFSMEAQKNGVQPIVGLSLTIQKSGQTSEILLYAKNENGYQNLLLLSSYAYINEAGQTSVPYDYLSSHSEGLIALTAGPRSFEELCFKENKIEEAKSHLVELQKYFKKDLYIEICRSADKEDYEDFILDLAYELDIAIVATNEVCFLKREMYEAQDAFICIANARYVIEEDRPKANQQNYFKSQLEMLELFKDLPEAIENTLVIARKCQVFSESRDPLLPRFTAEDTGSEATELETQALKGLANRIKNLTDENERTTYFDRIKFELNVINNMNYAGYFLIVSDFIKWSKSQGIPVGPGRGSGAGSVVAWALEITDLDPLQFGLLFERFLNPDRVSMPDFDIDFCQDRREEVINYVQDKYGKDRVAQIITFGKLQARAVLRDVGRVLGLPYNAIDKICKMVPNNPANPVTLGEAINLDKELRQQRDSDENIAKLLSISLQLEGLNRHVSTHAAGIVIADRPIIELVPLYKDQNSTMNAVQYSMKYAEAAGLVKFDFLGLKTLTVISWACKLIEQRGTKIDLSTLPLDDKKTYHMLSNAETVGVFQFEGSGMREAIKKLKPDAIGDLIALGSLYRPGPMDNIPSYINRKHGLEKPEYLHPKMESILKETYGIIVYQEQVMEIARALAGYTLGGADLLRRAMGKKIKAEMEAQRGDFIQGCVKNGIDKSKADEIFALIEKFASYGFNKSHAAAYAIISYQTAYLKANFTLEFLVASLNLEIDDTDKINTFLQEAKHLGLKILPPDVNYSQPKFSIEGDAIRFGLGGLKNVGIKASELIEKEREANGKFKSIYDLFERCEDTALNKRLIESFAKCGALDGLYENRREIVENTELLLRYAALFRREKNTKQIGLFGALDDEASFTKPSLKAFEQWSMQEKLKSEFEAFGFYLSSHPLEEYAAKLAKASITESNFVEMKASIKGTKLSVAGVVTSRKIKSSPKGKYAFIQISDRSGLLEICIFNEKLLIENEEALLPGKIGLFRVEARRDDTGLRVVVESILNIENALGSIQTSIHLHVQDPNVIPFIKQNLAASGKIVKMSIEVNGNVVYFKAPLFVDAKGEQALKTANGIVFREE
jgi:DNA polymerase-3 subunit alpha